MNGGIRSSSKREPEAVAHARREDRLRRRHRFGGANWWSLTIPILSGIVFGLATMFLSDPLTARADTETDASGKVATVAVLAPLDFELTPLLDQFHPLQKSEISGIRIWTRTLPENRRLVFAVSGTGKVNTAMTATLIIQEYHPQIIVMVGTAGSLAETAQPGDVCISSSVCYHDIGVLKEYGIMRRGFRSPTPGKRTGVVFDADEAIVANVNAAAKRCTLHTMNGSNRPPRVFAGRIACGDVFMASQKSARKIAEQLQADAIEMEGAALAQVCSQFDTAWIVIRGLCGSSGDDSGQTFMKLGHNAARNGCDVTGEFVRALVGINSVSKGVKHGEEPAV